MLKVCLISLCDDLLWLLDLVNSLCLLAVDVLAGDTVLGRSEDVVVDLEGSEISSTVLSWDSF